MQRPFAVFAAGLLLALASFVGAKPPDLPDDPPIIVATPVETQVAQASLLQQAVATTLMYNAHPIMLLSGQAVCETPVAKPVPTPVVCPCVHPYPVDRHCVAEYGCRTVLENLELLHQAQEKFAEAKKLAKAGRYYESVALLDEVRRLCPGSNYEQIVDEFVSGLCQQHSCFVEDCTMDYQQPVCGNGWWVPCCGSGLCWFSQVCDKLTRCTGEEVCAEPCEGPCPCPEVCVQPRVAVGCGLRCVEGVPLCVRMMQTPITAEYHCVPLGVVLDGLRGCTGIPLKVESQVCSHQPVSLCVCGAPMGVALDMILQPVGYCAQVRGNVVVITKTCSEAVTPKVTRTEEACEYEGVRMCGQSCEEPCPEPKPAVACDCPFSGGKPVSRRMIVRRGEPGVREHVRGLMKACYLAMEQGRHAKAVELVRQAQAMDPQAVAADPVVYKLHLTSTTQPSVKCGRVACEEACSTPASCPCPCPCPGVKSAQVVPCLPKATVDVVTMDKLIEICQCPTTGCNTHLGTKSYCAEQCETPTCGKTCAKGCCAEGCCVAKCVGKGCCTTTKVTTNSCPLVKIFKVALEANKHGCCCSQAKTCCAANTCEKTCGKGCCTTTKVTTNGCPIVKIIKVALEANKNGGCCSQATSCAKACCSAKTCAKICGKVCCEAKACAAKVTSNCPCEAACCPVVKKAEKCPLVKMLKAFHAAKVAKASKCCCEEGKCGCAEGKCCDKGECCCTEKTSGDEAQGEVSVYIGFSSSGGLSINVSVKPKPETKKVTPATKKTKLISH
jgi:hypothetical protein